MSLTINTKTNVLKDGTTRDYHYIYVIFGEGPKEVYNCGRAEDQQSYEKAMNKIKEILEREYYTKIQKAQEKVQEYMSQYMVKDTNQDETMVEESNQDSEEPLSLNMVKDSNRIDMVKVTNHIPDNQILEHFKKSRTPQETILAAFRLYEQKISLEDISDQLNTPYRTVQHWEKKFKQIL